MSELYSELIDRELACEDWLIEQLKTITDFVMVSDDPADLLKEDNLPMAVVVNDDIGTDLENPVTLISIVIKNKGTCLRSNQALTREIFRIIEQNETLGDKAVVAYPIRVSNDLDSTSATAAELKNVFTRIVLEVQL